MPKKAKSEKGESLPQLSYEEALKRLEAIVEGMEGDDLALEALIAHYEEGMRLRRVCLEKLAEAEVKIRVLEESLEGEFSSKPLTGKEDSE